MRHLKWIVASVCALLLLAAGSSSLAAVHPYTGGDTVSSYSAYSAQHASAEKGVPFAITAADITSLPEGGEIREAYEGYAGAGVILPESGKTVWTFTVPQTGLYTINFDYYPRQGRGGDIEQRLLLDGALPFREADAVVFQRYWKDAGPIVENNKGDDVQPGQAEIFSWRTQPFQDYQGYHNQPFEVYLTAGTHTLSLETVKDSLIIGDIYFAPFAAVPTYAEYVSAYQGMETSGYSHQIEAEAADIKSTIGLSPAVDRSSAATSPTAPDKHKLNIINGANWRLPGQWLSWQVTVEKSGLYQIALRWAQKEISGFSSGRRLYIDGELPFAEAASLKYPYTTSWQVTPLAGDDGAPYLFYLEAGTHEIRLEATAGDMASIISRVDACLSALNADYRRIVQLTGANPDNERDYELERYVPDVLADLAVQKEALLGLMDDIVAYSGAGGESTAEPQRVITQIEHMLKRVDKIPSRMTSFKIDLGMLGDWLVKALSQPLSLDYLLVTSPDVALPQGSDGFLSEAAFQAQMFGASFEDDNNYRGDSDIENAETITVWIGSGSLGGRDQAQLLRKMIDNDFTPASGINVNLQLVSPGTLLPSTFAGKNPDVSLQMSTSDIVNYGLRAAVADLTAFDDFEEVAARFAAQSLSPYRFEDQVFGIPETQVFPMLFIRTDILEQELGYELELPLTWDDILVILPTLQKAGMQLWIPPDPTSYYIFLKQYQGDFYRTDSLYTALDSPEAFQAFKFFTDFYTAYKLEKKLDFMNRFRTGEAPIGLSDYTLANTLSIAAPEIRGLWTFVPIPGVVQADGSLDNTGYLYTQGCVMLEQSQHKEAAWDFIKWWTDGPTQATFAREIEAILGTAGRYTPANTEAFLSLSWSNAELDMLTEQLAASEARREMPGGYYTERQVNFAIRSVIIDENNPRESLLNYAQKIDEEIESKANELGIDMQTPYWE